MATYFPLSRGYLPESPVTCWHGNFISHKLMVAHALTLADLLPKGGAILNLCEDRASFVVGWIAALSRGLVTILPSDRTRNAIQRAATDSDTICALIDCDMQDRRYDGLRCTQVGYNETVISGNVKLPDIAADQVAAILYTSGSTGQPEPLIKRWGNLVTGAQTLGGMLGWKMPHAGTVLGAVAPQHMFGLETTIMLPLQWGSIIHPERPLLPADMLHAISGSIPPIWLMVTPLHADSYVAAQINNIAHKPEGIISSTMPLQKATADALERLWDVPVWEIYGSTEVGMIGLRRTAHNSIWRLAKDLSLTVFDDHMVVSGRDGMPSQKVNDRLRLEDANHFELIGRRDDVIKIAGKRAMLSQLNAVLCGLPGVREAVLIQPRDGGRLVALVVANSGMSAHHIRSLLSPHFDPVFLPRPVLFLDQLPRNDNGKLPRQALLDMINHRLTL